jgi:hypothetical protein
MIRPETAKSVSSKIGPLLVTPGVYTVLDQTDDSEDFGIREAKLQYLLFIILSAF